MAYKKNQSFLASVLIKKFKDMINMLFHNNRKRHDNR